MCELAALIRPDRRSSDKGSVVRPAFESFIGS
jgi:hypothetical protein